MAIDIRKRPYAFCFSGNPVHYELYSALALNDSSVYLEVRVQFKNILGSYSPTEAIEYAPSSGVCTIDLADILDGLLEHEIPGFALDELTVFPAAKQTGKFYLQYREITPQNPDPSWDDSEKEFERFVVKGGISLFKYQGNNFWVNYFNIKRPFLTWQKSGRKAYKNERMYLLWLNNEDLSGKTIAARATVFFSDGTNQSAEKVLDATVEGIAYYIPAGISQWGLQELAPTKRIYYWQIAIYDITVPAAPVPLSETFKFEQDNRNNYNDVVLHYRNSLGGLDSVTIRGVIEYNLEYEFAEQSSTVQPDYFDGHYFTPQRIIANSTEKQLLRGDVGHLSKEEQDRLRDTHLNRNAWWCIDQKWWPVNILSKNFTQKKSNNTLWSFPIDFALAHDGDQYYTPMSVDLGQGVFTSNVCLAKITGLQVNVNFDDPSIPSTDCLVTFSGNEVDPQNASVQFRWRVLPEKEWQLASLAQLPITFQFPRDLTRILEVQSICTNDVYGSITTVQIDTNDGTGGGDPGGGNNDDWLTCTITNGRTSGSNWELYQDGQLIAGGYVGADGQTSFQVPPLESNDIMLVFDAWSPTRAYLNFISGSINYTEVTWLDVSMDHDFNISIL